MYKLLELRSYLLDDELYKMFQEIPKIDEFGQTNEYFGKTKNEIIDEINSRMMVAYSLSLSRNVLPAENYVLYVDDKPVAIGGLRFKLNNYWKKHSGNIWYKTRPSEQRKGYGSKFVEILSNRAKELRMTELIAQCDKENIGSNKVLKNNGFEIYTNPLCPNWTDTNFYKKILKIDEKIRN